MTKMAGVYFMVILCLLSAGASADYMQGFVGMEDFSALAADWQDPADIDDLAFLAANWLAIYTPSPSLAWWEMEETSGTDAFDSTVNAYDLVSTDGFVIADATTAAQIGNGFLFDGSGERLTEPTLLDDFPDAITIAGWVRPDATGMSKTQTWFSKINADALGYSINLTCKMSGSTPNVIAANGRSYNPATEPTPYVGEYFNCNSAITWVDDTWYHIAFTWDATGCEIFVDGQPEGSDDMPIMGDVIPDRNAVDLTLGNGGDTTQPLTEPFKGTLDDVMIYDSVLSASEIQALSGLTLYSLVVNNGSGDGEYTQNTVVDIVADAPAYGQEFDVWTGDTTAVADVDDPTTTVTMPPMAVAVTATYKAAPQYTLTVNDGTGDGSYYENEVIDITANTPPSGYIFDAWVGDTATVADIYDDTTTVTMPGQNVTLTATYKEPSTFFTLTVNNGTGDGDYEEDTVVNISANAAPSGQVFDVWTGDTAYVGNVSSAATTFTMPAQNASVTATYKTNPLPTPTLAWWEMEETSGSYAYDSANNYDLVPGGGIAIEDATTNGKIGKAFMIPGDGGRFTHPTLLDTLPSAGLTIMGWIRPDATYMSSDSMCWLSKYNGTNNGTLGGMLWMNFSMSGGTPTSIRVSCRTRTGYFASLYGPGWSDDTWYHYALVWDSGSDATRLYIDGDLEDSDSLFMGNLNGSGSDLYIGTGGASTNHYKGLVDDVRFYSTALSQTEIQEVYNNSGTYPLMVNNGTGDGTYDAGQVVDIVADPPPTLEDVFDVWTGDTAYVADIYDPATTVTMPAGPVTVTATYKENPDTPFIMNIRTNFPGGNALIEGSAANPVDVGATVGIAPDQRDTSPSWFYWCIEATANQPGEATFILPADKIGNQGPAVSYDEGATWDWMGTDTVSGTQFTHYFTQSHLTVRFAVTLPYLQSDLDAFLAANASNQHLSTSTLVQTNEGRNVELLQIGTPGTGKSPVLFTSRHHASETMATHMLMGFVEEAISNSPDAIAFRNNYVLYVVPFVDKDGVEHGDQGKNRSPHDHNRDYDLGTSRLYEEIGAIEALGRFENFQFVMDWHCPTLLMDGHQRFYFAGYSSLPSTNTANVNAFLANIEDELPYSAPAGPVNDMSTSLNTAICSHYFSTQSGMKMATTLEVPYAPPGKDMDPASCRSYGAGILRAWVDTNFQ